MILDGKAFSKEILQNVESEIAALGKKPSLLVIVVGDDEASKVYVRSKKKLCEQVGIGFNDVKFEKNVGQEEIISEIEKANKNPEVSAILVQLPLPDHLEKQTIIEAIDPLKDVDGLTAVNLGNLLTETPRIVPGTPKGIMKLLDKYNVKYEGKHAVVIGRSTLVGKPLSLLLTQRNATVTLCHSKTHNLDAITKMADILISATGTPKLIKAENVKEGAVIVDVGISREGKNLTGDVDFENVVNKASLITPVPGGVGPMTTACLLENVVECFKLQKNSQ